MKRGEPMYGRVRRERIQAVGPIEPLNLEGVMMLAARLIEDRGRGRRIQKDRSLKEAVIDIDYRVIEDDEDIASPEMAVVDMEGTP